jgi:hypothetical protein
MQNLRAIRNFQYNGKYYGNGQTFSADDKDADYLIYRKLAVNVSITPEPAAAPILGENKMLKIKTVKKPVPVSKRK